MLFYGKMCKILLIPEEKCAILSSFQGKNGELYEAQCNSKSDRLEK